MIASEAQSGVCKRGCHSLSGHILAAYERQRLVLDHRCLKAMHYRATSYDGRSDCSSCPRKSVHSPCEATAECDACGELREHPYCTAVWDHQPKLAVNFSPLFWLGLLNISIHRKIECLAPLPSVFLRDFASIEAAYEYLVNISPHISRIQRWPPSSTSPLTATEPSKLSLSRRF